MNSSQKLSELELVAGCQRGEARYQRALYDRYHRLMFGVCLRYTDNRDDAQDIMQEGFIKVFRHIHSFQGKGSFEGWVRRIMVHTSIEHYRRNSRYFMVDINEASEVRLDEEALHLMSRDELLEMIQHLPPGYRTVFNLYAIEGYAHQEIADMLSISVGTSKSQLSRARRYLQQQLEKINAPAMAVGQS